MIYTPTLLSVTGPIPGYNQATIQCQEKLTTVSSLRHPPLSNAVVSILLYSLNQLLAADFVILSSVAYTITVFAMCHDEDGSGDLMALFPDLCSLWP